jgi:protein-S-isoprenylcysteine O-methyltransferase Ste14
VDRGSRQIREPVPDSSRDRRFLPLVRAWLVATLAGAVALMFTVVGPREERYLEERFGADYLDYKASVRRWL